MTVLDLVVGYLAIGVGLAGLARARRPGTSRLDAVLLLGLWPVFGPVLAAADAPSVRDDDARIVRAEARLAELDAALARPELDEVAARERVRDLAARGAGAGVQAAARARLATIVRLRALRGGAAAEVEESREALAERRAQAELARLDGNDPDRPDVPGSCWDDRT